MIGIIPSINKTFEVEGYFTSTPLIEGKLYIDPDSNRVYMYSLIETRPNPNTGFFPVWNGTERIHSKFANEKTTADVVITDIEILSSMIDKATADNIIYLQRRAENDELLLPTISDGDNMFTQCIKGILNVKRLALVDLVKMSGLDEKKLLDFYTALTKITFMRIERWNIWIDVIFRLRYIITIYRDGNKLIMYSYPANTIERFLPDGGYGPYTVAPTTDDPLKRIVKSMITLENITKETLQSDEVDDYTINNFISTVATDKPLSAQLFCRFILLAGLAYTVDLYEKDELIFQYKERM